MFMESSPKILKAQIKVKILCFPLTMQHHEGMIWRTSKSHERKKRLGYAND